MAVCLCLEVHLYISRYFIYVHLQCENIICTVQHQSHAVPKNRPLYSALFQGQPLEVVSETVVDIKECTHLIPQCTARMIVQPMYTQRYSEYALCTVRVGGKFIPASQPFQVYGLNSES